jgi:Sulfotransferase family
MMRSSTALPTSANAAGAASAELQNTSERKPKIIFIASTSHSGSTLLDLMLNAHPEIVSVGELKQIRRYARLARKLQRISRCTCGATNLNGCPFWKRVDDVLVARTGRGFADLNVEDYADTETFNADNAMLYGAISAVSGKSYIVDSSKHLNRLELLVDNPALDVFPIFLLRDPKGQICSTLRKTAKPEEESYGFIRLIASYVWTNYRIQRLIAGHLHAVLHYEELIAKPVEALTSLMQVLGLTFHPYQLDWASQERHNIGGNRMRFETSSKLKQGEQWRSELTFAQRLLIDVGTLPARYPMIRLVPPAG